MPIVLVESSVKPSLGWYDQNE